MTQALLYSIAPQHMLNILNGRKTIEVRKRDLPQWAKDKLARGEIVQGYGYCTKGKPYLFTSYATNEDGYTYIDGYNLTDLSYGIFILNSTVVVKFEVSGSDEIRMCKHWNSEDDYDEYLETYKLSNYELCDKACLSNEQLENYLTEALGYAHHITNIQPVYMELWEFYTHNKSYERCPFAISLQEEYMTPEEILVNRGSKKITKAPKSFQTVWVEGE